MTSPAPATTAEDALNRLYDAVDDHRLAWLDDLTIAAGLRRRCANCNAMAALHGCDQCGTTPAEQTTAATPNTEVAPHDSQGWPLITREQAESWAGRALTDEEMDRLDNAIPNSSIPDAIATIIDSFETAD